MSNNLRLMNGSVYVEHNDALYNTALIVKSEKMSDEVGDEGRLLVTVLCPFCGKKHKHGVNDRFEFEHRLNDCGIADEDIGKGYYIIRLPKLIY